MKRVHLCRVKRIVFAVMTLALLSLGTSSGLAQQAGDMVEVTWSGVNTQAKVDTCNNEACNLYLYDASSARWSDGTGYFRKDQIRGLKNVQAQTPCQEATDQPSQKGVATNKTNPAVPNAQPAAPSAKLPVCSFAAPGQTVSKTASASKQLFERVIFDWFDLDVKPGGTTNPLKVGITFLEFEMAKSIVNRLDAGAGAHRQYDGAPVDEIIYPVKTKYIYCRAYRNEIQRQIIQENFACFKDKFGDWTCPPDNVRRILETMSLPPLK